MTTVDEKEILEIEKIKKEIHHMTFKEFMMLGAFFTTLGAFIAKVF